MKPKLLVPPIVALPRSVWCLLTIVALGVTSPAKAQLPDSIRTYLDSALTLMQTHSLYADRVNWAVVRDTVRQRTKVARTYQDVFPALTYAFAQLRDEHGMVANQDTFFRYVPQKPRPDRLSRGIKKEYLKGPRLKTQWLAGRVGYLRMPTMIGTQQTVIDQWANRLRDSLCRLLADNPAGLVLDLRMNNGGNSAPMFSGISPLWADSLLNYALNRAGKRVGQTLLRQGVVHNDSHPLTSVGTSCIAAMTLPLAVLIGPATASSGEIIALSLRPRPRTRLFGEPSAGFCTTTEGYVFHHGKGYLLLSTSYMADARHRVYQEEYVAPDEVIQSDDRYSQFSTDPTVQAALHWLRGSQGVR